MENSKKKNYSKYTTKKDEALSSQSRRDLFKKVAWSAPVLTVMGQLLKPEKLHADGTRGPDGPPGGGWQHW